MKMAIILGAILLGGCVSPQDMAAMRQQEAYQAQQQEQAYMHRLRGKCVQFGFPEGSQQNSDCMMRLHQQNQANIGAAAAAFAGTLGNQSQPVKPRCSSLPPGVAGYEASQGRCY